MGLLRTVHDDPLSLVVDCDLAEPSVIEFIPAAESAMPEVPIHDNIGTLHDPITTTSQGAQQRFDQERRMAHGFNHEEAMLAFETATHLDTSAAIANWWVALALGPNIGPPTDKADERRAWRSADVTPASLRF